MEWPLAMHTGKNRRRRAATTCLAATKKKVIPDVHIAGAVTLYSFHDYAQII
jgi:hypothetical protein